MLRNIWFWLAVLLIALGIALTVVMGVFYWLVATGVAAVLMIVIVFLISAYAVGSGEPPRVSPLGAADADHFSVVYDCDLTMGRLFRDVSDGLALLYLLGEPRIDLSCVTTTYGNGSVKMTTRTTRRLLDRLGFGDLVVAPGADSPDEEPETNQAARLLVDVVNEQPNEIILVATGGMTNLGHAAQIDAGFFKKLRGLCLMGGLTGPLTWNRRQIRELNFSLDPEAAYKTIHADCPIVLAPGQAGLTAIFRSPQFAALQAMDDPVSRLIVRKVRSWFALMRLWFQDDGFAMEDSVPALTIAHPELFEFERVHLPTTREDLRAGCLVVDPQKDGPVRLVRRVQDYEGFIATHFAAWLRLGEIVEKRKGSS